MGYESTVINDSATIAEPAGSDLDNVHFLAAMHNDTGEIVIADGSKMPVGVIIPTNDQNPRKGETVHIQIRYTGLIKISAAVKHGDPLTVGGDGRAAPAADGKFILGYALSAGADQGDTVRIDICKSGKAAAATP